MDNTTKIAVAKEDVDVNDFIVEDAVVMEELPSFPLALMQGPEVPYPE